MPTTHTPRRGPALSLLALVAALAGAAALPEAAQARERHVTATGPNGQTATRDVVRQNGDVDSTTTLPNGKTSSRSVDRSASGATATLTGPNGKSATRVTTRGDGSSATTVTGANGKTASRTVVRQP